VPNKAPFFISVEYSSDYRTRRTRAGYGMGADLCYVVDYKGF